MADGLYEKDILRLAAEATGAGRLPAADATATLDNPLCGDRVTIDICIRHGQITAVGHEVKACVLCQAAASVIGAEAPGRSPADISLMADALRAFLRQTAPLPDDAWPGLRLFAPVVPHKSRHTCLTLPFDALLRALAAAPVTNG